jgi:endoglucanase
VFKTSLLTAVIVTALGSTAALAQSQPGTRAGQGDGSTTAGSSLERSSQSYDSGNSGRDAAQRSAGGGTSDGMAGDSATGTQGSTTGSGTGTMSGAQGSTTAPGGTTSYGSSGTGAPAVVGAAGRAYDGSTGSGPASRADVVADRDSARRGERWIFNDADGVRRLDPGENSHAGRVYKGAADTYNY